jgi:endonuclease G
MAKRTTRKSKSPFTLLSQNFGKIILALIATGSFAIAFGNEKSLNSFHYNQVIAVA